MKAILVLAVLLCGCAHGPAGPGAKESVGQGDEIREYIAREKAEKELRERQVRQEIDQASTLRRKAFVEAHQDLSAETRQSILEGKVRVGMAPGEAGASWGSPVRVIRDSDGFESWEYPGAILDFQNGRMVRWTEAR